MTVNNSLFKTKLVQKYLMLVSRCKASKNPLQWMVKRKISTMMLKSPLCKYIADHIWHSKLKQKFLNYRHLRVCLLLTLFLSGLTFGINYNLHFTFILVCRDKSVGVTRMDQTRNECIRDYLRGTLVTLGTCVEMDMGCREMRQMSRWKF